MSKVVQYFMTLRLIDSCWRSTFHAIYHVAVSAMLISALNIRLRTNLLFCSISSSLKRSSSSSSLICRSVFFPLYWVVVVIVLVLQFCVASYARRRV